MVTINWHHPNGRDIILPAYNQGSAAPCQFIDRNTGIGDRRALDDYCLNIIDRYTTNHACVCADCQKTAINIEPLAMTRNLNHLSQHR